MDSSVFDRARELADEAEHEVRNLQEQRREIDEQIKTLRRFARVMSPDAPAAQDRPRRRKKELPKQHPQTLHRVGLAVGRVTQPFTVKELMVESGYKAEGVPSQVIERLRELGLVRLVGRRKAQGMPNQYEAELAELNKFLDQL